MTGSASEPWSGVGGARAGHAAGTWAGKPRCSRMRRETSPASMNAITRMLPPQLAQRNTSSWKTRRSSDAQSSRRSRGNDGRRLPDRFSPDENSREVWGRPVGLLQLGDGSMLVTDDGGEKIWRITYA